MVVDWRTTSSCFSKNGRKTMQQSLDDNDMTWLGNPEEPLKLVGRVIRDALNYWSFV